MVKNILFLFLIAIFLKVLVYKGNVNASSKNSYSDTSIIAFSTKPIVDSTKFKEVLLDSMINFAKKFIGLPYRYKGFDNSGFDCSGYIHYVFNNFGYNVPRSSIGLSNIGKEISFNNLRKTFSVGSTNTVSDYLSWLADAYLMFFLPRFSWSVRSIAANPRKVYAIDNGLVNANTLSFSADRGRMLENVVYQHLRRRGFDLYYFRENRECDFVVFGQKKCIQLIQVCEVLDQDTLKREVEGLQEAMKYFKMTEGYILTIDQKDSLEIEGLNIRVLPVFEFITMK